MTKEDYIIEATKLKFYKKLEKKLDSILNAELDLTDYAVDISHKVRVLENKCIDMQIELDISDEDINKYEN